MAKRVLSVARIQEIQRLIQAGHSNRQIAQALRCRRSRVREIRELGEEAIKVFTLPPTAIDPPWAQSVHWPVVLEEIGRGFEIKRIWEERAASHTSYSNFWKYLTRRYPSLMQESVVLREFEPGTHCEVDWAGDTLEWWDESRHKKKAHLFVGILCHSQLIFAYATEDEKKVNWLNSHGKMYSFFGGVPCVTVPDNLKTGTKKAHLYDPDLNPDYAELAVHYQTAVVPARVRSPRDKALVENAVGIVMRLFRWRNRYRRFYSLSEINEALLEVVNQINHKAHSRLKVSRRERFESVEKEKLKPLPETPFEQIEWRICRVHPDSTVALESNYYSVPYPHRGKEVRVKLTSRQVEIFLGLERVALHSRHFSRRGKRILHPDHLPPNAKAYLEATPKNLLAQARFISPTLHDLIDELLQEDALGHLRRAQGLIRHARGEIQRYGREEAEARIREAIAQMRSFGKIRVLFFEEILKELRPLASPEDRTIQRKPGNPMLRGTEATVQNQPQLLLLERNPNGTHTTESFNAGAEVNRHGNSLRSVAPGGQETRTHLGGEFRSALTSRERLPEKKKGLESDQVFSAQSKF